MTSKPAKRKEIRHINYVSSAAAWAMACHPEQMNRLIEDALFAQWVQSPFEINGRIYTIRASYRRGVVTLSAPTEA